MTAHSDRPGDEGSVLQPTLALPSPASAILVLAHSRPEVLLNDCLFLRGTPETCTRLSFRLRRGYRFRFGARKCGLQVDKQEAATAGPGARGVGGRVELASPCLRVTEKAGACQERDARVRIGVHVSNARGRCRIGAGCGQGCGGGKLGADVTGLKGALA